MLMRDAICLSTQINLHHVFKMSAFGTYACLGSCMPLINGRVNCALFNAVPNVYLRN